jgi:flagellar export protein FliJ
LIVRRPVTRLLALRRIEEERDETELRKQRQLREACLDALEASEASKALASRALQTALGSGDRADAISAEMALACGPMKRRVLQRRLAQLDAMVEMAATAWQSSRVRRLQMESLVETAETNYRKEMRTREQKTLDGWFLSSRPQWPAAHAPESFQRERAALAEHDGPMRAKSIQE